VGLTHVEELFDYKSVLRIKALLQPFAWREDPWSERV